MKEYHGIWPQQPFTRSSTLTEAIAKEFKNPFKFEYAHGVVGDIFAEEHVSTVVVNLMRGVLNMLNIDIRRSENVYDVEEVSTETFVNDY